MEICFTINGVRHCYFIPILAWPIQWWKPGPGPVNYPPFIQDVFLLGSVREVLGNLGDNSVRTVALRGIDQALEAVQKHAGGHVSINTNLER